MDDATYWIYAGNKNDTERPDTPYTLEQPGQWQVGLKVYKGDFFKVTQKDNIRNGGTSFGQYYIADNDFTCDINDSSTSYPRNGGGSSHNWYHPVTPTWVGVDDLKIYVNNSDHSASIHSNGLNMIPVTVEFTAKFPKDLVKLPTLNLQEIIDSIKIFSYYDATLTQLKKIDKIPVAGSPYNETDSIWACTYKPNKYMALSPSEIQSAKAPRYKLTFYVFCNSPSLTCLTLGAIVWPSGVARSTPLTLAGLPFISYFNTNGSSLPVTITTLEPFSYPLTGSTLSDMVKPYVIPNGNHYQVDYFLTLPDEVAIYDCIPYNPGVASEMPIITEREITDSNPPDFWSACIAQKNYYNLHYIFKPGETIESSVTLNDGAVFKFSNTEGTKIKSLYVSIISQHGKTSRDLSRCCQATFKVYDENGNSGVFSLQRQDNDHGNIKLNILFGCEDSNPYYR